MSPFGYPPGPASAGQSGVVRPRWGNSRLGDRDRRHGKIGPFPGGDTTMRLADPTRLQSSIDAGPEFRMAARYWNATLTLDSRFRAAVPRPFYQDLLGGCVQHHGFQVAGDMLSLSAYYQAAARLFAVMRALGTSTVEGR